MPQDDIARHRDVLVELQADLRPPQEARERTLARLNRLAPHVPAVQLQQVEAPRKHVPVTVTPAQPPVSTAFNETKPATAALF
jgi:hypothetical protein